MCHQVCYVILRVLCCRECAIKFNDYFEFPRQFDMEPFTVQGLAKIEGESHSVSTKIEGVSQPHLLIHWPHNYH